MTQKNNSSLRSLWAWAFYDWAASAFSAIITTFVFAAYFVTSVAPNKTEGVAQWGLFSSLAGLIVSIGAPLLGAWVDQGGYRKRWLIFWTMVTVIFTALLWFVKPSPSYVFLGLFLFTVASIGEEFAYVFYNAMLPDLVEHQRIGRWSGWAWGLGYLGGMISLTLALAFLMESANEAQGIRLTFILAAVWFFIFSLPLFLLTPKDTIKVSEPFRLRFFKAGYQVVDTLIQVKTYRPIYHFLIARMIFTDALMTLFTFGGIYAAAAFQMSQKEVLIFGIALNISAGLGALMLAYVDDVVGSKATIIFALIGLIVTGTSALVVQNLHLFWLSAMCMGLFIGPAQSSSRAFLAKVIPPELTNQMFGLFALSSKVTSFIGPLLVGWVTYWSGSLRLGMSTIIVLLIIGLILMVTVSAPPGQKSTDHQ